MKKKIPTFSTDEEAERFVDTADLSEYDLSDFKPVQFKLMRKSRMLIWTCRKGCSTPSKTSEARGIPFVRYIRELMERDVSRS